jgi:hypothetical protein
MRAKITNKKEYFFRHFELSKDLKQEEAWRQLEAEFYEDNGKPLYTTYESFRTNKTLYYKNKANR